MIDSKYEYSIEMLRAGFGILMKLPAVDHSFLIPPYPLIKSGNLSVPLPIPLALSPT